MQGTLKFKVAVSFFPWLRTLVKFVVLETKSYLMLFPQYDYNKWTDASGNKNIFFTLVINTFLEKKTFSIPLNQGEQKPFVQEANVISKKHNWVRPTTQGRGFLWTAHQDRNLPAGSCFGLRYLPLCAVEADALPVLR